MAHFWIMTVGCLVAATCAVLSCFLVLRKMSMLGDAISHAVLPGLVIAFLISASRSSFVMLIGAAAFGLLAAWLIEYLSSKIKLQSDASIGITFTFLFAAGIILISMFAGLVDIDQDCVLYGEIAYVPLDRLYLSGADLGPRALWICLFNLTLVLTFVLVGYKGLQVTTFNPEYAGAIGISTAGWQFFLMGCVSLTTVFSFELVGAILVVVFLVVPGASAYLLTSRLKHMIFLSVLLALIAAVGGFYLAWLVDGSISGGMASVAGLQFVICFLLYRMGFQYPAEGAVSR